MKNLIIIGGSGALGKATVNIFKKSQPIWKIFNIDYEINSNADFNYKIESDLKENELIKLRNNISSTKIDCIINTAGGWEGSSISNPNIIESSNRMMKMNLNSSILSGYLASNLLNENSLIILTGSAAVKESLNPEMLSYHLSKQSVHNLTELLYSSKELPNNTKIITILPTVIDTLSNRNAMKDADYSKWVKPEKIAETMKYWADHKNYPNENYIKF